MPSYLVLGCGMGKAIAYNLANQKDTDHVTVIDKDRSVLKLGRILNDKNDKCEYLVSDLSRINLDYLFRQYDTVISALPAKYNFDLSRTAVDQGVNFCDLGGVVDITLKQIEELSEEAQKNKVSIIPDCGLMPGMGVIFAKKLWIEFGYDVDSITIYVGGMPQKPSPPVYYQKVFNYEGLASICYEESPILRFGKIVKVEPMSESEKFTVNELKRFSGSPTRSPGQVEAFITAGASVAPWTFKTMGVRNFCEKTVRWPGFMDFVKDIPRSEFQKRLEPHINTPVTKDNPDLVWMKVRAIKNSQDCKNTMQLRSYSILDLFDEKTGLTAMERTTGFPTAIIARMTALKQSSIGVNTPETAFRHKQLDTVWQELARNFDIKSS